MIIVSNIKKASFGFLILLLLLYGKGSIVKGQENINPAADQGIKEFPAQNEAVSSTGGNFINASNPAVALPGQTSNDPLTDLQNSMTALQKELEGMKKDLSKEKEAAAKKKATLKLGGDLLMDTVLVEQSDANRNLYGNVDNQYQIRDVRLCAIGQVMNNVNYEFTVAFQRNIAFKNVLFNIKDLPYLGNTTLGYFKVETGIGHLEGIYDTVFSDFDSNTYAFRVGRRFGIGSAHYFNDQQIRWFNGIFIGQDFSFSDTKELAAVSDDHAGIILNTRLSGTPIYCENAEGQLLEILHLGGSFMWCDPNGGVNNKYNLRWRPNAWSNNMAYQMNGNINLGTGTYSLGQAEAAWQRGEFGVVSEFFAANYSNFDSAYGFTLTGRYFLTKGAYHSYKKETGVFGGVKIPEDCQLIDYGNRRCFQSTGAWEIAEQWSWTDMNNLKDIPGARYGEANSFTTALNWYWCNNARLSLNYTYTALNSALVGFAKEDSSNNTIEMQMRARF